MQFIRAGRRWAALRAALGLAAALTAVPSQAQLPSTVTALDVRVTRDAQPVASAVVCVGTSANPALYGQQLTNSFGQVRFEGVPPVPFVVTGGASGRGAAVTIDRLVFGPSTQLVPIALPASGGPACPAATDDSLRTRIVSGVTLTPPTVPTFGPLFERKPEKCFGALGAQCGEPLPGVPLTALCAGGRCFVNGGSWDHDECCSAHPGGMACRMGPLDAVSNDGNCQVEWDKALRLVGKGLNWPRAVDFDRINATGRVEHALYCAPPGTLVPAADAPKCCSRALAEQSPRDLLASIAKGEPLRSCR